MKSIQKTGKKSKLKGEKNQTQAKMAKPCWCRPKTRSEIKRIWADSIKVTKEGVLDFHFMPLDFLKCSVQFWYQKCFLTGNNSKVNGNKSNKTNKRIPELQQGPILKKNLIGLVH